MVNNLNINIIWIKLGFRRIQGNTVEGQAVTGEQVITIEGKNLFDIDGNVSGGTLVKYNDYGLTLTKGTNRTVPK